MCARANIKKFPFPKRSDTRADRLLFRVHLDICGPLPAGYGGYRYFMSIVDCCSRWRSARFLKQKSDALAEFTQYKTTVERYTGRKIAVVRLDNAREFVAGDFQKYCDSEGISFEKTVPYASPQNGVAERSHALLCSMARAMLVDANLPDYFWPLAIQTANHILNRLPTSALPPDTTPFHLWMNKPPDLSHLRIFGSRVIARKPNAEKLPKTAARGELGRFVGYATDAKGYLIWMVDRRVVRVRRDVQFLDPVDTSSEIPATRSTMWDDVFADLERRFMEPAQRAESTTVPPTQSDLPYVNLSPYCDRTQCSRIDAQCSSRTGRS